MYLSLRHKLFVPALLISLGGFGVQHVLLSRQLTGWVTEMATRRGIDNVESLSRMIETMNSVADTQRIIASASADNSIATFAMVDTRTGLVDASTERSHLGAPLASLNLSPRKLEQIEEVKASGRTVAWFDTVTKTVHVTAMALLINHQTMEEVRHVNIATFDASGLFEAADAIIAGMSWLGLAVLGLMMLILIAAINGLVLRPIARFSEYVVAGGSGPSPGHRFARDEVGDLELAFRQMREHEAAQDALIEDQRAAMVEGARLATIGEMAGGIAHEINNPLAIISGKTQLLRRGLAAGRLVPRDLDADLAVIGDTTRRIARIVEGMRHLARDAQADPMERLDIDQCVQDALAICQERFKSHGMAIRTDLCGQAWVRGRRVQLGQVLLNLLSNSFDATEGQPGRWLAIATAVDGDQVVVSVTDSGAGIPEAVRSKMMQPFFTTKAIGRGTGLGLSISQRIIAGHEGSLTYDAACPNTRFVIRMPAARVAQAG